jgi:V8-like Glu-specific endopeptidase
VRKGRWGFAGAVAVVWIAGCGSGAPVAETTGTAASAIQGGATDTEHLFSVGVVQLGQTTVEFCSGSLLAPNLVVTARHCVAALSSPQIDCSQSTFGALVAASTLFVTTDTVISQNSGFVGVAPNGIYVPSGPGQDMVCGNDIAVLVLAKPIDLPGGYPAGYVVPAISPPLTDPSHSTTVAAIGYGIDTPTDDAGVTAGTRRIKENVSLACIPNDPNFTDCFADPQAMQFLSANEFISGDETTCEGDSGSSVYDQTQFNAGKWVGYGVLSRGSVSADGLDCVQPIYTRFDAWGALLAQAAAAAAQAGGYTMPSWATGVTVPADASPATPSAGAVDGTPCSTSSECESQNCLAYDGAHYYCASACVAGTSCVAGFMCVGPAGGNYCFPSNAGSGGSGGSSGCAVASPGEGSRAPASGSWFAAYLGVALGMLRWRNRRTR